MHNRNEQSADKTATFENNEKHSSAFQVKSHSGSTSRWPSSCPCWLAMTGFYVAMFYKMLHQDRRMTTTSESNSRRKRYLTTSFLILASFLVCWLPGAIW